MITALIILILTAGLVNLTVLALLGILAVYRLMPRQAAHPIQSRKEEKKEDDWKKERRDVGTIKP